MLNVYSKNDDLSLNRWSNTHSFHTVCCNFYIHFFQARYLPGLRNERMKVKSRQAWLIWTQGTFTCYCRCPRLFVKPGGETARHVRLEETAGRNWGSVSLGCRGMWVRSSLLRFFCHLQAAKCRGNLSVPAAIRETKRIPRDIIISWPRAKC